MYTLLITETNPTQSVMVSLPKNKIRMIQYAGSPQRDSWLRSHTSHSNAGWGSSSHHDISESIPSWGSVFHGNRVVTVAERTVNCFQTLLAKYTSSVMSWD